MEAFGKAVSSSRSRYLNGLRRGVRVGERDRLLPECDCLVKVSRVCLVMSRMYAYIVCEPVVLDAVYILPQYYILSVGFLLLQERNMRVWQGRLTPHIIIYSSQPQVRRVR
jgi:hypothetical protein